jgi:hypothetical protein
MLVMPGWPEYRIHDPEQLISSNVADEIEVWDSATEYFVGDFVYGADGTTVYECAVGPAKFLAGQYCDQEHNVDLPNIGNDPEAEEPPTVPAMDRSAYPDYVDIDDCFVESGKLWWIKRGEFWENQYRMLDPSPDSVTHGDVEAVSTIVSVIVVSGVTNTVCFSRLYATSIRIQATAINGTPIDKTLDTRIPADQDLPGADLYDSVVFRFANDPYVGPEGDIAAGSEVTVTITHNNALRRHLDINRFRAECGFIYFGRPVVLGNTLYGTSTGVVDYSKKDRDAFGRADILERGYTNKIRYRVEIPTERVYATTRFLTSIRALPSVFTISYNTPDATVTGIFKDFSIPIESFSTSIFDLEVEGL